MTLDTDRQALNRFRDERYFSQKLTRRTAISSILAVTAGLYALPLGSSNYAFAQESEWITQDLVTPDSPVTSEGEIQESGSAIKIVPIAQFQLSLNSPTIFKTNFNVAPSEGTPLARTSGGVLISKDPFSVYDPEKTSWLGVLFFRGLYGVGQDQGAGTINGRSFPEEFQSRKQDLAILLDEEGKNATVSLGDNSKKIFANYSIERPLRDAVSTVPSLYIAAYSRPGSKTTVDRFSVSYRDSTGK